MKDKYLVEIQQRPNESVLYVHSKEIGITVLRICGLPKDFDSFQYDISLFDLPKGTAVWMKDPIEINKKEVK